MDSFHIMGKLPSFCCVFLFFYFAESKTYTGTIYAHNWFKLWVNGREVAVDPVVTSPQNAVKFTFDDDSQCRTYAIFASDGDDTDTGLTPNENCIASGGIRIVIDNEIVSNKDWKYHRVHYGPTNWQQCVNSNNCWTSNIVKCGRQTYSNFDAKWCLPNKNHDQWNNVKEYTENDVGYGTKPNVAGRDNCVDPSTVDWKTSKFIWGSDDYNKSLELDNDILLWYRKCDDGATPPTAEDDGMTCTTNRPSVNSETCRTGSSGTKSSGPSSSANVVDVKAVLIATLVSLTLLFQL